MTRSYWLGAILIPYLVVTACTSLSQDECHQGNWFEIGQNDGIQGRPLLYFEDHVKACTKHGVKPDRMQYEDGRIFGLAKYCTPQSGFRAGRKSQKYQNVCPPELQGEFIRGNKLGTQFGKAEHQLNEVVHKITKIESTLKKGKVTPDQQHSLNSQLGRLRLDQTRLEEGIRRLRHVATQTL